MKFVDYICPECSFVVEDVGIEDGVEIPYTIKCPNCGERSDRKPGFNKVIPKRHRAV